MSTDDTRKEGLREAGIIADRVFDEQDEGSRGQQVAARIRHLIVERMNALAAPEGKREGSGDAVPEDEATVEAAAEEMWRTGPLVDLFPGWSKAAPTAQDNFRAYARAAIRAINKLRGGTP